MESFQKFIEVEDADPEMMQTRNNTSDATVNNRENSAIKQRNLHFAKSLLQRSPQMLLSQVVQFDKINPNQVSDMIDFARKHDFDESMPLHSLVMVYNQYKK